MYQVAGTSTADIVFGEVISTIIYAIILGVIFGYVWWLFKRPR